MRRLRKWLRKAAKIYLSLGVVHQVRGQAEQAIAHFTVSLDTFEAMGDDRRAGHTHLILGTSYRKSGAWRSSGINYEKSLVLARAHDDLSQIGMIYLRRAETQILISDASMAMLYSRRAMRLFVRIEDPLGQADAYRTYRQAASIRSARGQDRDYLTESLSLQQKYKSLLGEAETLEVRGQFYEMKGEVDEARARYEQAFDLFQRLNAENDEKRVKDIMEQLA